MAKKILESLQFYFEITQPGGYNIKHVMPLHKHDTIIIWFIKFLFIEILSGLIHPPFKNILGNLFTSV